MTDNVSYLNMAARVHAALEQMDGPPSDEQVNALAAYALDLIERLDGNVGLARRTWAAAFDEAERLDHNMTVGTDDPDDV
jgi:hypothetical protein